MAGLNKVMIIGNLTRDPEVTYLQSGSCVCKISVATSETWNDKNSGEKKEKTEFHRIVFFGKQGEVIGKHFFKGKQIYVEGKLQTSQYEKDGVTMYSTDIVANNFQFIGSKHDGQQQQQNNGGGFQQQARPQQGSFQQQGNNQGGGFSQHPDDDQIHFAPNVA